MENVKQYKFPMIIAIVQWYCTTVLQVDKLFFDYDFQLDTVLYRFVKLLYLLVLILAWCYGFYIYRMQKISLIYKRYITLFSIYFSITLLLLLFLWPGTWAWDDLGVIEEHLLYYNWDPWQHILTSIFQLVCLQFLPFPGGIILIQNIIISICVAFCIVKIEQTCNIYLTHYKWLDIIFKLTPFLLPPILMYQFSGYRIGLYVYLELTMLCILVCSYKDSTKWSVAYTSLFVFLCAIVSTWRTESLCYIPVVCIALAFFKNILSTSKKVGVIFFIILSFNCINYFQNNAVGNNNYKIVSTLRPLAELIKVSDPVQDAKSLAAIDKVINLEIIYNNPHANGEELYWEFQVVRNEYSEEDYSNYLDAFLALAIKYPKTVLFERFLLFLCSTGFLGQDRMVTNVDASAHLYWPAEAGSRADIFQNIGWVANSPIFPKLRESMIYFLGMRTASGKSLPLYGLIWNAFIPFLYLLVAWIKLLIKKQWLLWVIVSSVIIKVPLIFMTQPANWFMYWLSICLIGYVYFIFECIALCNKKMEGGKNNA